MVGDSIFRAALILALITFGSASGCRDPEEECRQARVRATRAWKAYLAVIEPVYRKAVETQVESKTVLAFDVKQRISKEAQAKADERYDRSNGAWQRAYQAAFEAACREDKLCGHARLAGASARSTEAELSHRVKTARAARDAASGRAREALVASSRVPDDYANRKLIKAARAASEAAFQACRELKPGPRRAKSKPVDSE